VFAIQKMGTNPVMKFTSLYIFLRALKKSFQLFGRHDTLTLGAALAYYTGFSLIPIIIIVISITGAVFGPQAVRGEITRQLESFIGNDTARQLEEIIRAVYSPGKNWLATTIAFFFLAIGASSVFCADTHFA
jgi:membrane protein